MSGSKRVRFGEIEVNRMVGVGQVGPTSARIWLRSDRPGKHELLVYPLGSPGKCLPVSFTIPGEGNDNTWSVLYPGDFPECSPLEPLRKYRFRVTRAQGSEEIGSGGFETAPATAAGVPGRFSIGVMSCHQPFDETSGELGDASMRMLRLTRASLAQSGAKFILLCGDQIYADHPARCSLFDAHYTGSKLAFGPKPIFRWPVTAVRAAYQQRYRQFWWMKEIQYFHAQFPCYPILDDHEIVDDWGSEPIHVKPDGSTSYARLREGALSAYADYQATRIIAPPLQVPSSFHYSFDYGTVGCFVMDLRSQRSIADGRLFGEEQFRDLQRFLQTSGGKHVLLIVTSVPVVHLPDWLTSVGASIMGSKVDFPDHWSFAANLRARNDFLRTLYKHQLAHPKQRVILVSGDVHVGCAFSIRWEGRPGPTLYQFTSSAISNKMKRKEVGFSVAGASLFRLSSSLEIGGGVAPAEVALLPTGKEARSNNPFGGLNLGLIEVENRGIESTVVLKLIGYTDDDHTEPAEMFTSRKL